MGQKAKDLTDMKFGELTAIKIVDSTPNGKVWECKCSCGNVVNVISTRLLHIMRQELNNRHVLFDTQYSFPDFISDKNRPLRFDFAILDADKNLLCLVEYQGIQHDKQYEKYHVSFGEQQRNVTDKMKQEYCKSHNILLFEIWYNQNIGVELDKILQSINYKPILCQASIEEG